MKTLFALIFTINGEIYVEDTSLLIQECAGRIAMLNPVTEQIRTLHPDFDGRYSCVPDLSEED